MAVITIDSQDDERLADYRNIPDPELARRRGMFVAEGRLVVRRLLGQHRIVVRSVMMTDAAMASISDLLGARPNMTAYRVTQPVMDTVAGFNVHRGCLAIGERPPLPPWTALVVRARTVVVIENVGNPDNVGGIFRNAAAFGANAVLLGPGCADPLYRKAIRTSMGAALALPFAAAEPWPDVLRALEGIGFSVIALTPSRDAPVLANTLAAIKDRPVAVVLGHEADGLTPAALDACRHRCRIPMDTFDSLNVATAAAVALYELRRHA